MTDEEIKQVVKQKYGEIATQSSSCCGPSCGCGTDDSDVATLTMSDAYKSADPNIVATADLGLGCGTPTAFTDLKDGMVVLDLGSGAGIDVFLAAQEVAPSGKAIGLDMTEEMIERANTNKSKLGIANAEFVKGEIEDMPVLSTSVDRIISNCVINLVPDKHKAFAEMYRVLRPGGKFIVSDIVTIGDMPEELRKDLMLWAGCVAGAIDKDEYISVARQAGFTALEILVEKPFSVGKAVPFGLASITLTGTK